jgi:hypothetical protein
MILIDAERGVREELLDLLGEVSLHLVEVPMLLLVPLEVQTTP